MKNCTVVLAFHEYCEQPYDMWFPNENFVFIAPVSNSKSFASSPSRCIFLEHYEDIESVKDSLSKIAEEFHIELILARAERDILRAATLREQFGVQGFSREDAEIYRNKLLMYQKVSRASIPVMPFDRVESVDQVHNFISRHGKSVIKPIYGSGSSGVEIIDQPVMVESLPPALASEPFLIQKFADGAMWHLDGIWDAAAIRQFTLSKYVNTCLSFKGDSFLGSVIQNENISAINFENAAFDILSAMGVAKPLVFHLEVFVDGSNWSFCEIAARPGGARIVKAIEIATGKNLDEELYRIIKGQSSVRVSKPSRASGWLLIPPKEGKLKNITFPESEPWIVELRKSETFFGRNHKAQKSGDYLLTYVICAANQEQVETHLEHLGAQILGSMEYF